MNPRRDPPEDSIDLYPDLAVGDEYVGGSIRLVDTRLPLWAIIHKAITKDWSEVVEGWPSVEAKGFTAERLAEFLRNLLELRGEFARLLLIMANAEFLEEKEVMGEDGQWYDDPDLKKQVADQLQRCLDKLKA